MIGRGIITLVMNYIIELMNYIITHCNELEQLRVCVDPGTDLTQVSDQHWYCCSRSGGIRCILKSWKSINLLCLKQQLVFETPILKSSFLPFLVVIDQHRSQGLLLQKDAVTLVFLMKQQILCLFKDKFTLSWRNSREVKKNTLKKYVQLCFQEKINL